MLAPHDAPLMQVGGINTGRWSKRLSVRNGHLYGWVMNNMWYANFPASQEGVVELSWSVESLSGSFDAAAAGAFARAARIGVAVAQGGTK